MAKPRSEETPILEAALTGLQYQHRIIDEKISEIKKRLGIRSGPTSVEVHPEPKKRKLSATARKRIADATRKRWAAYRKAKAGQ